MFRNSFLSGLRNTSGIFNNSLPFNVPNMANTFNGTTTAARSLGTASKLSFTSILDNASKTINTINQIVPLYQQVKPMFNNAKTALNIFKSVKNIDTQQTNTTIPNSQINETNIKNTNLDNNTLEQQKIESKIIITQTTPNKPFFV